MTGLRWPAQAPLEIPLSCSDARHRVRWSEGRLEALDHADPEGERTLVALGGPSCACVQLLDVWSRHADDLRVLTLASRGPGDVLAEAHQVLTRATGPGPTIRRARRQGPYLSSAIVVRSNPSPADDDLMVLLAAGSGLWERLVTTIIAEWTRRLAEGDERCSRARAALTAALFGRVAYAIRQWMGDPDTEVAVHMAEPGQPPSLTRVDDQVVARLPFSWLHDLWSSGQTVLLGRFCVAVVEWEERGQRVLTVGTAMGAPELVTVTLGRDD